MRQFLENDRGVETRQRRAADIFFHVNPAETERRCRAQLLDREDRFLVPLAGARHHFVARETTRGVAESLPVLRKVRNPWT